MEKDANVSPDGGVFVRVNNAEISMQEKQRKKQKSPDPQLPPQIRLSWSAERSGPLHTHTPAYKESNSPSQTNQLTALIANANMQIYIN